jgi:hypothetical protein
MKKYKITLSKEFFIKANDEVEANDAMIDICANDSEILMPHNMEKEMEEANGYTDDYFIN